jgi:predicted glycosyltransferase
MHFGKNPYENLDPLYLGNFTDRHEHMVSCCDLPLASSVCNLQTVFLLDTGSATHKAVLTKWVCACLTTPLVLGKFFVHHFGKNPKDKLRHLSLGSFAKAHHHMVVWNRVSHS